MITKNLIGSLRARIILVCLCLAVQSGFSQNSFQFQNEFNYILEGVSYSTPIGESRSDFLGWLNNTSTLKFKDKHSFNVSLMITHDNMPSALRVGDLQTFSNLEAGNLYGFYEVYYQFKTKNFELKIGDQDINSDFFVTENGLLFAHSSMGLDPVASINMPGPSYPYTAFAVSASLRINQNLKLRAGVFDGQFAHARDRFLPISWTLRKDEGLIYVFEPEITLFEGRATTKLTFYHHSDNFVTKDFQGFKSLWGFFSTTDFLVSQSGKKSIHAYYQVNTTTKPVSDLDFYFGVGMRFVNALPIKCENELGVGIASASINTNYQSVIDEYGIEGETVLEINWKAVITDKISLQPYFQFIKINDIGNERKEPIVVALRAFLSL